MTHMHGSSPPGVLHSERRRSFRQRYSDAGGEPGWQERTYKDNASMEVLHGSASAEVTFLPAGAEVGTLSMLIDQEVDVPRPTGPTIARWQLARELRRLREAAGITHREIAEELGCSESKIYKIESGDVGLGRSDLLVMLDRYGLKQGADDEVRATLLDWQKQGKERGWWAKFGQLPNPYSMYIGLESAATAVRNFELAVIPGLLQTEEYARALITQQQMIESESEIEKRVQARIARQECLVDEPRVNFWTIIDEAALRRRIGGTEVMRGQLAHLLEIGKRPNVTVQVLPFSEGAHPGTLGSIAILEFPEDVHSPVAYIETYAGDVYLESDADIRRVTLTYTHMHCAALSPSKSRELIAGIAKELA